MSLLAQELNSMRAEHGRDMSLLAPELDSTAGTATANTFGSRSRQPAGGPCASSHFLPLLCSRCSVVLPRELFGLGRCPSCMDYDGPGRYAAALAAMRPPPVSNAAAEPCPPSRLQRARLSQRSGQASSRVAPASMPVVVIGKQRFAAPVASRVRVDSKRRRAMLAYAHSQALLCTSFPNCLHASPALACHAWLPATSTNPIIVNTIIFIAIGLSQPWRLAITQLSST